MSGIEVILPWAIDNFAPEDYSSFQEWYDAVSADFVEEWRGHGLDDILDQSEYNMMERAWDEAVSGIFQDIEPETQQELIQEIIEEKIEEKIPEKIEDVILQTAKESMKENSKLLETLQDQEKIKPSVISKIKSFFRRLFKR